MRINTQIVIEIETNAVSHRESLDYYGPVEKCCGGDALAGQKKQEANQQVQLNQEMMDLMKQYSAQTNPFWMNRLQNGLPFFNQLTDYSKGTLAQAEAPMRAGLNRQLSGFGDTLPSGMKEQLNTNFDVGEGHAFDQNMVSNLMANEQSKKEAAASLNPFQPAQIASGSAGSVLGAPAVNSGGFGNFLGGAVSGLLGNASLGGGPNGTSWAI